MSIVQNNTIVINNVFKGYSIILAAEERIDPSLGGTSIQNNSWRPIRFFLRLM
jgi:hypothetical protein